MLCIHDSRNLTKILDIRMFLGIYQVVSVDTTCEMSIKLRSKDIIFADATFKASVVQ